MILANITIHADHEGWSLWTRRRVFARGGNPRYYRAGLDPVPRLRPRNPRDAAALRTLHGGIAALHARKLIAGGESRFRPAYRAARGLHTTAETVSVAR